MLSKGLNMPPKNPKIQRELLPCKFEGPSDSHSGKVRVLRGRPAASYSDLHFQAVWLWQERGGRLLESSPAERERPAEGEPAGE